MYRLAGEYAEYSTLNHLVAKSGFRPVGYRGTLYYKKPIPQDQQANWTNTPKLPLEFVLNLFIALVKAVQHLNIRGIVHRDLGKPDDILLGAETGSRSKFHQWGLKPLVTDFGLAMPITSTFENPQDMHENPGATSTLAPEQITTFPPLYPEPQDGQTNIYQLGILMAVVISGGTWYDHFEYAPVWGDKYMWRQVPPAGNADRIMLNSYFRIDSLRTHFASIQPLVVRCMRFRKEDRADLDELLVELRRQRAELDGGDEDDDSDDNSSSSDDSSNDSSDDSSDDSSSDENGNSRRKDGGHDGGNGDDGGMFFHHYTHRTGNNIFPHGARVNDQGALVNDAGHLIDQYNRLIDDIYSRRALS